MENLSSDLIKKIKRIEIKTKKLSGGEFFGMYRSAFKGKGIEFSEVREYREGDDFRAIDWNVTAKTGKLHIKEFVEERELNIFIVLDVSSSLDFGSKKKTKKELALELISSLIFSAIKNNDRVGLVLFTDHVEKYIKPRKSRARMLFLLREILGHKAKSKKTSLENCLKFLNRVVKRRSVIFLLSDFLNFYETSEETKKYLKILNKAHDLILVKISDPIERELPEIGLTLLEDPESGEQILVELDDEFLEEYKSYMSKEESYFERFVKTNSIDCIFIKTDDDPIAKLRNFFRMRELRRCI